MLEKIKNIYKKKPKAKVKVEKEVLLFTEDMIFKNEIKKPEVTERITETKSETKSSLTFGE